MARSSRRRIPFASVAAGLTAQRTRLDSNSLRQLDTSHGCQNHTLLPSEDFVYVHVGPARRGYERARYIFQKYEMLLVITSASLSTSCHPQVARMNAR